MILDEIKSGESYNIEFKETLPEKSIKYMKTVVAFANGSGGKIIFGIEDGTGRVVGIDSSNPFRIMDAITNAISDSCEPHIYPNISLQSIDGKTIIVVDIPLGRQRPYYIKSMGKEAGVFVRVSGTSRQADDYMIKELLFEGANRSFDQTLCLGLDVSEAKIEQLCKSMKETAIKNCKSHEEKAAVKDVTPKQLLSWGILLDRDGKYAAANAFALLTGDDILPTKIQCGVFKGNTKAVFVDRREYSGSIQVQVEEALQFVLRNIHIRAEFSGLARHDIYEIPVDSIRELLVNAVIHRSYLNNSNIQVAIYDDRLEITSPGKLPIGQSIEKMKAGYSQIRNKALAYAFYYMKMMENWGSGIPRIIESVIDAGLSEPEFIDGDVDLRVNIYRKQINKDNTDTNADTNADIADITTGSEDTKASSIRDFHKAKSTEERILAILRTNPTATQSRIASEMGITDRSVRRILAKLQKDGVVTREGTNRSGKWLVKVDNK